MGAAGNASPKRCVRVWPALAGGLRAILAEQARIRHAEWLAPTARPAHAACLGRLFPAQFGQSATNGAARQAGRPHHRADPAAPGRYRLRRAKTPTTALVQHWRESLIPHPESPIHQPRESDIVLRVLR